MCEQSPAAGIGLAAKATFGGISWSVIPPTKASSVRTMSRRWSTAHCMPQRHPQLLGNSPPTFSSAIPSLYSPLLGDSFWALRVDEPATDRQQRANGMLPIAFGPEDRSFVEHLADGLVDQDRRRNVDKGAN